jgi:hypothetical protein
MQGAEIMNESGVSSSGQAAAEPERVEDVVFKQGDVLHYGGMPFRVGGDIVLLGLNSNKELADSFGSRSMGESSGNAINYINANNIKLSVFSLIAFISGCLIGVYYF